MGPMGGWLGGWRAVGLLGLFDCWVVEQMGGWAVGLLGCLGCWVRLLG